MGTVFRISVAGVSETVALSAIDAALDEIARLEFILSEWRADSEISRINAQAGREPVTVGPETLAVIQAGLQVSQWSDGAFDMSWAALRDLFDFRPGRGRAAPAAEIAARLPLVHWQDVIVDAEASTVFLRREGMALGTGGIAKGYALDRAGSILRELGVDNYMMFGGGQVQLRGQRGDRPWRVGIQHPRAPQDYFGALESSGGSISTSGDYEHVFVDDSGKRWHHILDLRTGEPASASQSVTILSEQGIYADAISTAVFIMGPERGLEMLRGLPIRVQAVAVRADGRLYATESLSSSLRLKPGVELGAALPSPQALRTQAASSGSPNSN